MGRRLRQWLLALVLLAFIASMVSGVSSTNSWAAAPVSMTSTVKVPDNGRRVTLSVSDAPVTDILRNLSEVGNLNLLVDESITRTISVELNNVSINDALGAIVSLAGLEVVPQGGNVYLIIPRTRAEEVGLNRRFTQIIPVQFANANQVAALLNQSLFAVDNARMQQNNGSASGGVNGGMGGGGLGNNQGLNGGQGMVTFQKVRGDARTNSIIVVGSQRDIDLAEAAIKAIDKPRQTRTFYLNYGNALDIATQLMSSVFNDGTQGLQVSGGAGGNAGGAGNQGGMNGGMGGAGGQLGNMQVQQMPSSLRVESEEIEEGSGINSLVSGGSESSSTFSQEVVLRGIVKSSQTVQVSPMGVIVIPDTRLNAITVMGTEAQIALAEKILPALDAEPPQVSIEVSLIEVFEEGQKQLSTNWGVGDGRLQLGFNTTAGTNTGLVTNNPGDSANSARTGIQFSTTNLNPGSAFLLQLNALISSNRAKVLANPTIVANHDTEAIVSIVDQIVRRVNVTVEGLSGTTTIETEIGEAGIVLDILPKIGEDGTVSMRVRPSVTSIRDIVEDDNTGSITTLLTKRDLLAQLVRVKDGQTLMMGGLIRENTTMRKDKLPLLGDLPIVGALFRAASSGNLRSEVIMLLTPHILNPVQPSEIYSRDPLNAISTAGGM